MGTESEWRCCALHNAQTNSNSNISESVCGFARNNRQVPFCDFSLVRRFSPRGRFRLVMSWTTDGTTRTRTNNARERKRRNELPCFMSCRVGGAVLDTARQLPIRTRLEIKTKSKRNKDGRTDGRPTRNSRVMSWPVSCCCSDPSHVQERREETKGMKEKKSERESVCACLSVQFGALSVLRSPHQSLWSDRSIDRLKKTDKSNKGETEEGPCSSGRLESRK